MNTVDVVIVGGDEGASAAAIDAISRGLRVLVVIRTGGIGLARDFRMSVEATVALAPRQLTVITGAEVACVDGVNAVEAIVVRRRRSGRLLAFNASVVIVGDGAS